MDTDAPILCKRLFLEAHPVNIVSDTAVNLDKPEEQVSAPTVPLVTDEGRYNEYLSNKCKSYIRTYLNEHLDDQFFIERYSPLERHYLEQRQCQIRKAEAMKFALEYQTAVQKSQDQYSKPNGSSFMLHSYEHSMSMMTLEQVPCHIGDKMIETAVLGVQTHTNSVLQAQQAQQGTSTAQLPRNKQVQIISTPIDPKVRYLRRNVYVLTNDDALFDSLARRDDLEIKLATSNNEHQMNHGHGKPQEDRYYCRIHKLRGPIDPLNQETALALTVDASDMEAAAAIKSKLTMLSIMIARALDAQLATRLANAVGDARIHNSVLNEEQQQQQEWKSMDQLCEDDDNMEDLEIVAAYLRRVHYFDIVRPKQVDLVGICQGQALPSGGQNLSIELLSEYLNEITSNASSINAAANAGISHSTTEEGDQDDVLQEMLAKEDMVKQTWISEHTILADNGQGRARCAFRYCAKLFKSAGFLEKHLLKKHASELKLEQLKVHDAYIMRGWEQDPIRSCLPKMCMDCGYDIGFREVPVVGVVPPTTEDGDLDNDQEQTDKVMLTCHDPEPELAKQYAADQERRMAKRRNKGGNYNNHSGHGGGAVIVDVDDMVEEKVELKFKVGDGSFPVKKKKRKKKSL